MESSIEKVLSGGLFNVTTAQRGIALMHHWVPIFSVVYYGCFLYLLRIDEGSESSVDQGEAEEEEGGDAKKEDGYRRAATADSKALAQARLSAWVCGLAVLVLLAFVAESYMLVAHKFGGDDEALPAHHDLSFTLSVTLLWLTAFLNYIDHSLPLPKTIHACWASVFLEEFLLFSSSYRLNAADHHRSGRTFIVLQGARVFGLTAILVLVGASARIARTSDEKSIQNGIKTTGKVCCGTSEKNSTASASTARKNGDTSGDKKAPTQTSTWSNIKICFRFWYPSDSISAQVELLVYFGCIAATHALQYMDATLLSDIVSAVSYDPRVLPLRKISLYVLVKLLHGNTGISTLAKVIGRKIETRAKIKVVSEGLRHIMALSANYHDQESAAAGMDIITRAQNGVQVPGDIFRDILPIVADIVMSFGLLRRVLGTHVAFGAVAVSVSYIWISTQVLRKRRAFDRKYWTKYYEHKDTMYQCLNHWRTLVYFNRIPSETGKCTAGMQEVFATNLKLQLDLIFNAVPEMIQTAGLSFALFMAAHQIIYEGAKVGILVMVFECWSNLISPLQMVMMTTNSTVRGLVHVEKFSELLNHEPRVKDKPDCPDLVTGKGEVVFEDVKFHYEEKHEVLKGISFHAKPGQTVAFVGESGAGKSTILNLLVRLYDCTSGCIKIDGQEVSSVSQTSLRDKFGIVPQEPTLFNATILENLCLAKPDATEEEIHDVCRSVSLHDKFMSFPNGYETKVGENGIKLSGGERQRVAIARALLTNPTLVLLDEATSSVDSKTEAIIQESLGILCANRTTFVIAHRLSTIRNADKVLVIYGGRVAETGTHDELIAAGGMYHELWKLQSGAAIPFQKKGGGSGE